MKKRYTIFIVIAVIAGLIALSVMLLLDKTNLNNKTFEPDAEMESIYQQMLKPDGSMDPFIFDSETSLNTKQLGALLLATQNCAIASSEIPVFGPTCTPILAMTKYQDKTLGISDLNTMELTKNLAYHPNEYVRLNNISFLVPAFRYRPDVIFDYLTEQSTPNMDFYAYRLFHSRNIALSEVLTPIMKTPEYANYLEKLKTSGNPMVRAWVYEENMTPEQIADSIENTADGIKKVFHSDKVATTKEIEAIFHLFRSCHFKDSDLSLDGDCFALDPFRQFYEKRMFIQEELNLNEMLQKLGNHENPSVRGIAWSLSFHLLPDYLKKHLEEEKDVKAIAAFVYFSKLFNANSPELKPFHDLLKTHADPRVKALIDDVPLTAEEFETRLTKLQNCQGDVGANCPELLEFSSWFKSYSELPIEEKAVIAPVVDKYFKSDSQYIRMMTFTLGIIMAYVGFMPQPFDVYWNYISESTEKDAKIAVFVTFCTYAQTDPEGLGADMELKAKLQKLSDTMEPMDKKAARDEMLNSSFK